MGVDEDSLEYHQTPPAGKIEISTTKPTNTQRDLSLAYSPGVAAPCRAIRDTPTDAFTYTAKGNLVGVISDGSAVLGLGDIGAQASKPVMEGKGVLFKRFADIDVFDATHHDQAGAKLHLVHNVTEGTLERLDLTDERTHESSQFQNGSWLEGRLLLFDLGYFKHHRFARIDENGGFFVSRLKESSNPEVVEELRTWRGNAKSLVGEQVWDMVDDLHREEIDARVEITFERRAYRGQCSTDTATFRLVGLRNDATGEYHCYLTNLPGDSFSPSQVATLYRGRWEIELLFRELKSTYGLDELPSRKPAIVEVLILASILSLVVSRVLLGLFRDIAADRGEEPTFPPERLARTVESFAPLIADRLARHLGFGPTNLLDLMYEEAQKNQSRPLLIEQVNSALGGDLPA